MDTEPLFLSSKIVNAPLKKVTSGGGTHVQECASMGSHYRLLVSGLLSASLAGCITPPVAPVVVPLPPAVNRCVQPPHSGSSGFPATCPNDPLFIPSEPRPNPFAEGLTEVGEKTVDFVKDLLAKGKEVVDRFDERVAIDVFPNRGIGDTIYVEEFPISVDFNARVVDHQLIPSNAQVLWRVYEVDRDYLVLRREGPLLQESSGTSLHYVFQDRKEYKIKAIFTGKNTAGEDVVYSTAKFLFPSPL